MNATLKTLLALASVPLSALLLSGCGMHAVTGGTTNTGPVAGVRGQGVMMGGQQPIAGVSLQIYAVGTTGYGSAATPLLVPGATTTTPSGNFTFSSYTCPSGDPLVYLVGTGGEVIPPAGAASAVVNSNLALMVGLGHCSTIGSQYISVNELTTVATVWALSPFMTGITNVGAPASNTTVGLANAFAAINKIVNTGTGAISGPNLPTGATLPIAEINTLADILQQCVNSGGGSASDSNGTTTGTNCGKLFYLTNNGSTAASAPADTITAALNIAQNPGRNLAALNNLRSPSAPFTPTLSVNSPPSAWTIAISYTGGGLSAPHSLATDQAGNVWVTNKASVSEFNTNGAAVSGANGFTAGGISAPSAVAIDQSGNAWIANDTANSVVKLAPAGASGTAYSSFNLNNPSAIAIDGTGTVWVANQGGSNVVAFDSSTGKALAGQPFNSGVSAPVDVAISPK